MADRGGSVGKSRSRSDKSQTNYPEPLDMKMPDGISESTSDKSDSIHRPASGTEVSVKQMLTSFNGHKKALTEAKAFDLAQVGDNYQERYNKSKKRLTTKDAVVKIKKGSVYLSATPGPIPSAVKHSRPLINLP